jgi:hypothetical protein
MITRFLQRFLVLTATISQFFAEKLLRAHTADLMQLSPAFATTVVALIPPSMIAPGCAISCRRIFYRTIIKLNIIAACTEFLRRKVTCPRLARHVAFGIILKPGRRRQAAAIRCIDPKGQSPHRFGRIAIRMERYRRKREDRRIFANKPHRGCGAS